MLFGLLLLAPLVSACERAAGNDPFATVVRPFLSTHCLSCHDGNVQKIHVRLDRLTGGSDGRARPQPRDGLLGLDSGQVAPAAERAAAVDAGARRRRTAAAISGGGGAPEMRWRWPFGQAARDPAPVLGKAVGDLKWGGCWFRNRWQDGQDIIVRTQTMDVRGNGAVAGGDIMVWGLGQKTAFPGRLKGKPTFFKANPEGGVVSVADASFGVDFSGAAGVPALLVLAGPGGQVTAGGRGFTVMALGGQVAPKAEGGKVVVGGQTITLENQNIVFAK